MGQRKVVKQTSNHVFHNTNREMVNKQGYISPYMATSNNAPQYPSFSHGYNQHPYIWQQPVYQHFAQHPEHSAAVSSLVQQEQQQSTQPQPIMQENAQE